MVAYIVVISSMLCMTSLCNIFCFNSSSYTPTAVFRENRIAIVITYFEEWYKDNRHPTIDKVKDDICRSIKEKVGECSIPKKSLFPVCGIWANAARKLQSMPSVEESKQTAIDYWKLYKQATSGWDANEQLQSLDIASKLLKASGIKDVEQRYTEIGKII